MAAAITNVPQNFAITIADRDDENTHDSDSDNTDTSQPSPHFGKNYRGSSKNHDPTPATENEMRKHARSPTATRLQGPLKAPPCFLPPKAMRPPLSTPQILKPSFAPTPDVFDFESGGSVAFLKNVNPTEFPPSRSPAMDGDGSPIATDHLTFMPVSAEKPDDGRDDLNWLPLGPGLANFYVHGLRPGHLLEGANPNHAKAWLKKEGAILVLPLDAAHSEEDTSNFQTNMEAFLKRAFPHQVGEVSIIPPVPIDLRHGRTPQYAKPWGFLIDGCQGTPT
ncbi:uncharacterized protein EI90DRAFT_3121153 [Cantharellus anzutake]|uniref:uncharacterized protein n=1 Tax=Cantharellus anzutake TaxID=1750568 RepID=UPI001903B27C|nr:uncharacterized protein EI90DRAFT_3121153 [Cantharellus anzutake]KAF8334716.1 hypothetical protein EI90DRAFT_3121153 [Cantharellus anzutake]